MDCTSHRLGLFVSGILLPILGALPDCLIIVVSGMGPRDEAMEQVKVGLGTLAGSTVMLLTIAWGGSLLMGRCDLEKRGNKLVAKNKKLTKYCDVVETGVTADGMTRVNALIMTLSVLLYFIVHIPALAGVTRNPLIYPKHKIPSIVGFACCMFALVVYVIFQVVYPGMRRRVLSTLRRRALHERAIHHMASIARKGSMGPLVGHNGEVNVKAASELFHRFDLDNSGHIDRHELKTLLIGMTISMSDATMEKELQSWMVELDKDGSTAVSEPEFIAGLRAMLNEKKAVLRTQRRGVVSDEEANRQLTQAMAATPRTQLLDDNEDDEDEDEEDDDEAKTKRELLVEACVRLALGAAIAALFADPMVGTVSAFANASGIPPFFVAFVVTPLASNASELVSSLNFARKKKKKNISLTFSQVYGAVTMNNTLCLGLFLLVVFVQNLTWDFTAEVTAIVIPTIIVGCIGLSATTFRTYVALLVLPLYIVGICIVLIFKTCFPNVN